MLEKFTNLLITVLACILFPSPAFSEIAKLSSVSIVHTSGWFNWTWQASLPEDVISFPISGRFTVTIEEGGINPWTGGKYKDTIRFENIDVFPFEFESNTWEFPNFTGTYVESEIVGSEDPCFNFSAPGTCYSQGYFGWFQGTLVNDTIILKGGKDPYMIDPTTNSYYYEIEANIVKKGDLNGDGISSIEDVIFGLNVLAGKEVDFPPLFQEKSYVTTIRMQDVIETILLQVAD